MLSAVQATAPTEPAVEVENVGKCYAIYKNPADRMKQMIWPWRRFHAEYWALRNVSLRVARGETVGILGRNGAGKSTLLQLITGTLSPTEGHIVTHGRVAALLELGAGFNPEFTGQENVRLAATLLGLSDAEIDQRFDLIVEFANIGDFLGQPVKLYSSGMYSRLAFAVAAHVDADILIIDEILAVGDAAFTQKCMRFIEAFKRRGTILFVSHDPGAMAKLCDRIVWLDGGGVRQEGSSKEVLEAYMAAINTEGDGGQLRLGGRRRGPPPQEPLKSSTASAVKVFDFDPDAPQFGAGGARILGASLNAASGAAAVLSGGQDVVLEVQAEILKEMIQPILGFLVKDRLGQIIFVENTSLTHPIHPRMLQQGEVIAARFHFEMPYLADGDYAVTVAIAEGTEQSHVQHHWLHDAIFFRVANVRPFRGLVAVPMLDIDISVD